MFPPYPMSNPVSSEEPPRPAGRRRTRAVAAAAVFAAGALALFGALYLQKPTPTPEPPDYFDPDRTGVPPFAILDPPVHSAGEANLRDDEEVFGVSLGGKHRAYLYSAFRGTPMVHVVNDLIGDVPVTVSHCDKTGCTKVFTGDQRDKPLFVGFGGWRHGKMWVRADQGIYDHETLLPAVRGFGSFPYQELNFVRTTWKAWRQAHPDTDVYTGGGRLHPPRSGS